MPLKHVKTVKRRGKSYYYFHAGKKPNGKPLYIRLPDKVALNFGTAYAQALSQRTRRANMPTALKVPDLVALFQRSPEFTKRSQSTQKTYGIYLSQFARLYNTAPVDDVTVADMYMLIDTMADRPAAADMLLLVVRQLYKWARKRHHASADPTREIEAFDEGSEYEPWPEHLVEDALLDLRVRLPVALLYFTAQRIGDVCKMRWNDIRWSDILNRDVIDVTQQKTGKELEIPVHSRLAAILAETPRRGITILTDPKGRPAKDQTIRHQLQAFGREHGFQIVPHGLRKNAVNALIEAGCDTGQVSAISGQSLRIVEYYARKRDNPKMARAAVLKWERNG